MRTELPPRLELAVLPTPLQRLDELTAAWGGPTIWVKRDDLTGFGLSGNKVRKLEFHLAAAQRAGADTVVTCGAAQSNHCRATALAAAALGLRCVLLLRSANGQAPQAITGNYLLDRLAGAEVHFVTPQGYWRRDELMADLASQVAQAGGGAWVIPEGASDALGMWAFVQAFEELADQLDERGVTPAAVWHAASSGATTAGMGWAADRQGWEVTIVGCSVGDSVPELRRRIDAVWEQALWQSPGPPPVPHLELTDDHVGGGYGVTTAEELAVQVAITRSTGLLLDPTYTGKAFVALWREISAGRFAAGDHVVFWHTGGGFAVFAHDYGEVLDQRSVS